MVREHITITIEQEYKIKENQESREYTAIKSLSKRNYVATIDEKHESDFNAAVGEAIKEVVRKFEKRSEK